MGNAKSVSAVAGTFTATGASTSSRTCTTTDGKTIVVTDGKYTGTATGDSDLTGRDHPARPQRDQHDRQRRRRQRLSSRSTRRPAGTRPPSYSAVYDHGAIAGLASGRAHGPSAQLVANLSATFSAASGFTERQARRRHLGRLGGRGRTARSCKPSHPTHENERGSRDDLRPLGDVDHRRRPDLRDPVGQVRRRELEVQAGRRRADPLLAREQREHADGHRRPEEPRTDGPRAEGARRAPSARLPV